MYRVSRCAANGITISQLGRDSGRGKVLCLAVKCWLRVLQADKEELVKGCCEWQISDLKFESWANELSEELDTVRLVCISQNPTGE